MEMKRSFWLSVGLSAVLLLPLASSQSRGEIPVKMTRVSERILVLHGSYMENNVTAVATDVGLVVVDSTGIPSTARRMRDIIRQEFGRDDFVYLINTHYHWDHSWGNMAFPEATTIAHEGCGRRMRDNESQMSRTIESFKRNLDESRRRLEGMEAGSDEEKQTRAFIAEVERAIADYSEDFRMLPPVISFNDRMTLDLGDITLEMAYFGRSHSGTDIFIHIPEEGILLTGDIFLDGRWLPLFSAGGPLDIPRWIEVLDGFLGDDNIRQVIPGHQHFWPRARLELWRDYIRNLWEGLEAAHQEGKTLDQVIERFPLEQPYMYLKELGHDDQELQNFQERNIRAFWRQLVGPETGYEDRLRPPAE
jgi:glyoxylase-like metal-dependent hydrolase (beta-lactamase superfamily II)